MTRRAAFDGAHQEQALRRLLRWQNRALRTKSGKGLREVAADLKMSPATLARYLNGSVPLSSEDFAPFAAAFETTEADLIVACLPSVLPLIEAPYDPRAAMEASGVVSPHRIDQVEADVAGRHETAQRARVNAEIEMGTATPQAAPRSSKPTKGRRTG